MENFDWTVSDSQQINGGPTVELLFRNRFQSTEWRVRLNWDDGLQVVNMTTTDRMQAGECFEDTAREFGELLAS